MIKFCKKEPTSNIDELVEMNLDWKSCFQDGLIFFPEFCRVVLRKFREEDEEQFAQVMFKVRPDLVTLLNVPLNQFRLARKIVYNFL